MSRQGEHVGDAPAPIRKLAPAVVQTTGRRAALLLGRATAGLRATPDFVIAGVQRGGTTSLFRALLEHPQVVRPTFHKGVNYFDVNYSQGWNWYAGHFPLRATARARTRGAGRPSVFEASGYYLYHPLAIERLSRDLPDVKVVVMLRDPVERAFSAWKHEVARGFETESFERAVELEDQRIAGEEDRMRLDPAYTGWAHRHQSYLHRGHYADQLDRLLTWLPRERVHVIESDSFFTSPTEVFGGLTRFLGLADRMPSHFDQYNARPGAMAETTRAHLRAYFTPHDERLTGLLGHPPRWMSTYGV